ncbi:MAG: glycosyltransferase family 2 protein [Chloroflexota bacterium]|nr:glycosyltransferase family 2 protein [Chloroflexota bacterium]
MQAVVEAEESGEEDVPGLVIPARQLKSLEATASDTVAASFASARVSVIIPALNEAENLPGVLSRIPAWVHEVLLVDGNSKDDTVSVATLWWPSIRVVQQTGRGKGDALRAGLMSASGNILLMLDADGSMDPLEIPSFVGALLAGADVAKGSRFLQGGGTSDMPRFRQFGNWCFVVLVRLLFGGRYSDLCYGYNAVWARDVPRLGLDCDGFEIETVLNIRALRHGMRVAEVPSFESRRVYGTGRLRTIPDGWRVLKALLREGWNHHVRRSLEPALEPASGVVVQEAL